MYSQIKNINAITNINNVSFSKWEALLRASTYSTPFQAPVYYNFFESLEGFEPFLVILEKEEKYVALVTGVIQSEKGFKAFFSRRAVVYGGFVIKDGEPAVPLAGELVLQLGKLLKKRAIYLEIRNYNDYHQLKETFENHGYSYVPYLDIHVNCTDLNTMQSRLNSGKLRQIKKSLKNGAYIIRADKEEQIRDFYEILKDLYKTKVKKPLPGWDFFYTFFKSGLGVYLLVMMEEKVVGGIMCPMDDRGVYEWYIAGIDGVDNRVYPSVLATWAAMEFASKNGIPKFDFMGAGQSGKNYGVRDFKMQFGGNDIETGRFIKIFNPVLYQFGRLGISLLKKLT